MFGRALGDVFSQKIEGAKQVDLRRSMMTSVYGAAFIGMMTLSKHAPFSYLASWSDF